MENRKLLNDEPNDSEESECKSLKSQILDKKSDDLEELKDVWVTLLKGEQPQKQRQRTSGTCNENGDKADLLFSNLTKANTTHSNVNSRLNKDNIIQKLGGQKECLLLESKLSCLNREVIKQLILEILAEFPGAKTIVEKKYIDTLDSLSF